MACIAPNKLADGTEVACRECKQCQLKAKNDWIGRNIAESKTAKFCYIITATYGRGRVGESLHERAVILTYSDCQKLLKLLRRHGYEVRFFITGEYGSERGRAHWNIVLYSDNPLPAFSGWDQYGRWVMKARYKQRFNWVRTDEKGAPIYLQNGQPAYWWPHGFVHIDDASVGNIRYVCKYVLKDFDANGKQGHKGQSKDPPLGTEWFRRIAEKYVEQGLAPQSPEYRFPEARTREGEIIRFWLKGRPLEIYLQHYLDSWAARHGDKPHPPSELLALFQEYGRVVSDENKMLVRQAYPRGESKLPIPSAATIKRVAEERTYERAVKEYERNLDGLRGWYTTWIQEATSVEERQRRQEQCDDDLAKQWQSLQTKWGRQWRDGKGWVIRPKGPGPGEEPEQFRSDPVRTEPAASEQRVERLGPIGRKNRDFGPGPRTAKP